MKTRINLLEGNILPALSALALPIMATSLIQMAYNLIDMIWIGKIGASAVASVGAAGMFMWLSNGLATLAKMGGQIKVGHALGAQKKEDAASYAQSSIQMGIVFAIGFGILSIVFADEMIGFFQLNSAQVIQDAKLYLMITCGLVIFSFMNQIFTGILTAMGNSRTSFIATGIGLVLNIVLDPLFIFVLGFGIRGAAIATVISQVLSAVFVLYFLTRKSELKVRLLHKSEVPKCLGYAKNITSLGPAGFIMQITNSLVTICCNNVLSVTGGDIYISVMTIVSSVRQLVETPIYAMNEGTSPILSYNYGAVRPARVRKAILVLGTMILAYTAVMWSLIILVPGTLIRVFTSDTSLVQDTIPALNQYFAAFIFMDLQYIGQTVFKSLNKKKQAIFFSLLRKVFIVVPLTYLMPYALHMGTRGVFLAEPVSNIIGGSLCFITMLCTVLPELKRMEK